MSQQSDLNEAIRERAYQIWEAEGRPAGRDQVHWEAAERELAGPSATRIPAFGAMDAAPKRKKPAARTTATGKATPRGGRTRRV